MHERRAEPVAERLVVTPVVEERVEVPHHLVVKHLLGVLDRHAIGHALGGHLGEAVEPTAAFLVAMFARAIGGIPWRAGTPDLVRLANVIAGIAQHQRINRDRRIPPGPLQNRAHAGAEKVLAGEQRTAARRARRRRDKCVLEQHTLIRDAIKRRCLDDRIRAGAGFRLGVRAGVLAPVIGKCK